MPSVYSFKLYEAIIRLISIVLYYVFYVKYILVKGINQSSLEYKR